MLSTGAEEAGIVQISIAMVDLGVEKQISDLVRIVLDPVIRLLCSLSCDTV